MCPSFRVLILQRERERERERELVENLISLE
jgi:hypothetical protein